MGFWTSFLGDTKANRETDERDETRWDKIEENRRLKKEAKASK